MERPTEAQPAAPTAVYVAPQPTATYNVSTPQPTATYSLSTPQQTSQVVTPASGYMIQNDFPQQPNPQMEMPPPTYTQNPYIINMPEQPQSMGDEMRYVAQMEEQARLERKRNRNEQLEGVCRGLCVCVLWGLQLQLAIIMFMACCMCNLFLN
jgi:hypothetical protein